MNNEIYIDTKLDTENVEKDAKKIDESMEKLADKSAKAAEKTAKAFEKSLGSMPEKTEEYKELEKEFDKIDAKMQEIGMKQDKFLATGGKEKSRIWKQYEYDLEMYGRKMDEVLNKMRNMEADGTAFKETTEEVKEDGEEAEKTTKKLGKLARMLMYLGKGAGNITASAFRGLGNVLKGPFTGNVNRAKKAFEGLKNKLNRTNKQFGIGFKRLLKYVIGFRLLTAALRNISKYYQEGFQNLAKYNNGQNALNKSVSNIKSAMTQFGNSIAAAFTPIITVIEPIITRFINKLSELATAIGMVMAKLTGQSTFTKAIKVQKDYAKSLDSSASSAKKGLAAFDELNTLQSESGGASEDPNKMFETVEIPNELSDFADGLKEKMESAFEPLKNAWSNYGQGFINSAQNAFEGLKNLVSSIAKSFDDVWKNGTGEAIVGNILQIFTNINNVIGNISTNFANAWNTDNIGTEIIQSVANALNNILETINLLTGATANWVTTIDFSPFLESVLELQTSIESLVGIINEGLLWAWNNVILPIAGFTIENVLPTYFQYLASVVNAVYTAFRTLQPSLTYIWENLIKPMGNFAGTIFLKFLTSAKDLFTNLAKTFQEKGQKINMIVTSIGKVLELVFKILLQPLIQFAVGLFTKMVSYIGNLVGDLIDSLAGVIDFLAGVFTLDLERALGGIKDIFRGLLNFIVDIYEGIVNGIIHGINSISVDIPEWVPGLGGSHIGFNLAELHLPRLATGNVIPRQAQEQAYILGDNNQETEIVSPLSTMKEALIEALQESGVNQGGGDVYLNVSGDIGEMIRFLKFELAKENDRVGGTLVQAGVIS